jgi:triosephosphate isomerase
MPYESGFTISHMIRRPLIAGNWKMHFTVPEGLEYALRLRHALESFANRVDVVVLPPSLMLWEIANVLRGCPTEVGAQNASWEDQGPFTGEISPKMLAGWCHYLLIGHSERRQLFNETDEQLNRKLQAAFRNSLKVILAIGETLEEHDLGRTEEVITRQLSAALYGIEVRRAADLTIAYEPVWAIGTGKAATPEYASATMGMIRGLLGATFAPLATEIRILYGGSVTPANARTLMEQPNIDGALVGGASLKEADFTEIVRAAAEVAQSTRA